MLKYLLMFIALPFLILPSVVADNSDLIISKNPNFSKETEEFTAGETIHVKVTANSSGTKKHDLNLRDNQYNLLETYSLEYLGDNTFRGQLPSPQSSGYYSLEARVESEDSVSTSVKTIKVGEPTSTSVNVNVSSKTGGQRVLGQTNPTPSPSPIISPGPSDETSPTPPTETPPQSTDGQVDISKSFFDKIRDFFEKIFRSIWKF